MSPGPRGKDHKIREGFLRALPLLLGRGQPIGLTRFFVFRLPGFPNLVLFSRYPNLLERVTYLQFNVGGSMLLIQSGSARRFRKYSIAMLVIFLLLGSFAALLTLHWYVEPQKK
jgi:hypothetical protein